jgi:hypothetical protein
VWVREGMHNGMSVSASVYASVRVPACVCIYVSMRACDLKCVVSSTCV